MIVSVRVHVIVDATQFVASPFSMLSYNPQMRGNLALGGTYTVIHNR